MAGIRNIAAVAAFAFMLAACSNAPSSKNISNIGMPDKSSLPTPVPPGIENRSANANNPQTNAVGESQATNTSGVNRP